jgi:hypothetical protein
VLPLNGRPKRPAYNLAIPAVLFEPVRRTVGTAGEVGLHARRSVDYRKAAGRDIAPAQENRTYFARHIGRGSNLPDRPLSLKNDLLTTASVKLCHPKEQLQID